MRLRSAFLGCGSSGSGSQGGQHDDPASARQPDNRRGRLKQEGGPTDHVSDHILTNLTRRKPPAHQTLQTGPPLSLGQSRPQPSAKRGGRRRTAGNKAQQRETRGDQEGQLDSRQEESKPRQKEKTKREQRPGCSKPRRAMAAPHRRAAPTDVQLESRQLPPPHNRKTTPREPEMQPGRGSEAIGGPLRTEATKKRPASPSRPRLRLGPSLRQGRTLIRMPETMPGCPTPSRPVPPSQPSSTRDLPQMIKTCHGETSSPQTQQAIPPHSR